MSPPGDPDIAFRRLGREDLPTLGAGRPADPPQHAVYRADRPRE